MSFGILIIDNEPRLPYQYARFLNECGYEALVVQDGEAGLQELRRRTIDLVLLDRCAPTSGGLYVLTRIHEFDQSIPVVMLTSHNDMPTAVAAMKMGAADYILKGFEPDTLLLIVQEVLCANAISRELRQLRRGRGDMPQAGYIIGQSERMRMIFDLVGRVARSSMTPVLITGESGTGKEVIARAIHEQSPRARGPFLPLNCAAIANSLLESELFGYEPHAFTDAKKRKRGLFELAEGGTLFLDEVGEMSLDMQAKLLRVLETRSFFRLGGSKEVKLNVRVLAATNRDLRQAMQEKTFRSDLYYRLAVLNIALPPLRERPEDILLFITRFVEDFNESFQRNVQRISPEAQHMLLTYTWPGNVRELKNVIEHAMILSDNDNDELFSCHFPQVIIEHAEADMSFTDPWANWLSMCPQGPVSLMNMKMQIERHIVRKALEEAKHNCSLAAESLGLTKVEQLRYLMHKHGIEWHTAS